MAISIGIRTAVSKPHSVILLDGGSLAAHDASDARPLLDLLSQQVPWMLLRLVTNANNIAGHSGSYNWMLRKKHKSSSSNRDNNSSDDVLKKYSSSSSNSSSDSGCSGSSSATKAASMLSVLMQWKRAVR